MNPEAFPATFAKENEVIRVDKQPGIHLVTDAIPVGKIDWDAELAQLTKPKDTK